MSVAMLTMLFAVLVSSCSKYEEGPVFSLLTKKARITGEWKVEEVSVDNVTLSDISDYAGTYTYEKDGTGTASGNNLSFEFDWEFSEDKEELRIRTTVLGVTSPWVEYEIVRLTNSEFWIKETTLGITTETHLEKQ